MLPPAPGLFSITTGCFSRAASSGAMMRARLSDPPPGANGTIKRIGRVGKDLSGPASEGELAASDAARASKTSLAIVDPPDHALLSYWERLLQYSFMSQLSEGARTSFFLMWRPRSS